MAKLSLPAQQVRPAEAAVAHPIRSRQSWRLPEELVCRVKEEHNKTGQGEDS